MDSLFSAILLGLSYYIIGIILFLCNLYLFEKITPFSVRDEIFTTQNKALGYIVRGQILGQGIMIAMLIYFLGTTYNQDFSWSMYFDSLFIMFAFGCIGIGVFQISLYFIGKCIPLEKEIILDTNEALGIIIGGILVSISLILSVSLYSY